MATICDFSANFSIDSGCWKLAVKDENCDHMIAGHCGGCKCKDQS